MYNKIFLLILLILYACQASSQIVYAFESSFQSVAVSTEKNGNYSYLLNTLSDVYDFNAPDPVFGNETDYDYVNSTKDRGYLMSFSFSTRFERLKVLNYFDLGFYGGSYDVGGGIMGLNVGVGHFRRISAESPIAYRIVGQYLFGFDYSFDRRVRFIHPDESLQFGSLAGAGLDFPSYAQIYGGMSYEFDIPSDSESSLSNMWGILFSLDVGYAFINAEKLGYQTNLKEGVGYWWVPSTGGSPTSAGRPIEVNPDNLEYRITEMGGLFLKVGVSFLFQLPSVKGN